MTTESTTVSRQPLIVAAVLFALAAAVVVARFEVSTDITAFLPDPGDQEVASLSREIIESELSRTMVLTIHAEELADALEAGRALESALLDDAAVASSIAFLEGGPPEGIEEAMWTLYHPRRFSFAARSSAEVQDRVSDEALATAAADLLRRLEQPMSPLLTRVAPSDPLLFLVDLFDTLEGARGEGLAVIDGRFVGRHGEHAVLFLGTSAPAFDSEVQGPLLAAIDHHFTAIAAVTDADLTLEQSGVNRFAVSAEASLKADIRRVSTLSVLGLALLILALFRSPRLLVLAGATVGTGVLAGCAATLLVYGRVHGVTLAFGAALIGVALDYVAHLYAHHAVAPHGTPSGTLRTIWRALLTGAVTTVVGFAALAASSFGGLREVALFSVVGIACALSFTRWVLPVMMRPAARPVAFRRLVVDRLSRLVAKLRSLGPKLWALPVVVVVISAVGLPRIVWNPEFADLGALDAELVAEDDAVRDRVARFEQMRFVVALGETEEEALSANDAARLALDAAVGDGALAGYRSIATLLPSSATQRGVADAFRSTPRLDERLTRAFVAAGFRAEAVEPFRETLRSPGPEPLTYTLLADSPLGPLVRPFRVSLGERVAFVTYLSDVADPAALAAAIDPIDNARFLDQAAVLGAANHAYQTSTFRLVCGGLFAVLLVLLLRYRDLLRTLAAFVPALLGSTLTLASLGLLGIPLDLVGLTALLMVVSMGVDYGVFLVDAERTGERELTAALLSIAVACASTLLGFGLLALSDYPVLRTIGVTAGIGVTSCLLLAPTTLVLLRRER